MSAESAVEIPQVIWRVEPPTETGEPNSAAEEWVGDLWSLRGLVYYADGRRPQFRVGENKFCDADPADFRSYHVLAYSADRMIGCVRVLPLESCTVTTERLVGIERFRQLLNALRITRSEVMEGGRWAVAREYRKSHLGMHFIAGGIALGAHLGIRAFILVCGTRDRQNLMFSRFGGKAFHDISPIKSSEWDDDLQPMYVPVETVDSRSLGVIRRMYAALKLGNSSDGQTTSLPPV
jgi:hypothetical protein